MYTPAECALESVRCSPIILIRILLVTRILSGLRNQPKNKHILDAMFFFSIHWYIHVNIYLINSWAVYKREETTGLSWCIRCCAWQSIENIIQGLWKYLRLTELSKIEIWVFELSIYLRRSGDHILNEISVSGCINDCDKMISSFKPPQRNVDCYPSLPFRFQFVHNPSIFEWALTSL